ncbi:MltA domain-containing protein [Kaistia dalseonensis]|uniref:peptidoglycan lytic exotransglycosylase n=1 Tax=Kaistia dalseonensis TaxID=410840 RepID=A0ABU0H6C6_9HYPH|nr:MltA domain-containing protein [Kaistia dalseonensis]MCX5494847.1 MltA domain-containing protein [Kaistia dalseonensis]MDQ0437428.1 membrane-bound lytic murein transglycosylase A [Kaistia dalseonensis]
MSTAPRARLVPLDFSDLAGWPDDDHAAAWSAFRLSAAHIADHPPKTRALGFDGAALSAIARAAMAEPVILDRDAARRFFETHFQPVRVEPDEGEGFFTGFYEPEAEAALVPGAGFDVPLYRAPPELVEIDEHNPPPGLEPGMRFARKTYTGFEPFFERGEIERGALAGRGLELAFLADPVDAFFIHIQGAARLRLADGGLLRVTYAAKSGHAYTPIGRVMIEHGALQKGGVTMQTIRAWLGAHPAEARAMMWENRSFIFFREAAVQDPSLGPIAAAKVPLTPGRSLAVDRTLHTFHMPVWIETTLPAEEGGAPFRHLLVAQDTGSAILGAARGDIFFGSGDAAGRVAGRTQAKGGFVVLAPRRLG